MTIKTALVTNKKTFVTQPDLPPLNEFFLSLEEIWENKHITNMGPFHKEFEKALADYLGIEYVSLFSNGTLALITALQALQIKGEVITTPFSFVATSHSLWWNKNTPVFVDIEPDYLNLDPKKIEDAITENTSAVLPVHVYGNMCNVDEIQKIAQKHKLKVIYDAAHAFGVKYKNNSILNYGDLSILSFHATKVFNTIEGGAIISHSAEMKHHIDNLKNFGFRNETLVEEPGINAKMNELQAAYGLLQLKYVDSYITMRHTLTIMYREYLADVEGIRFLEEQQDVIHNYPYFPILIDQEKYGMSRDALYEKLRNHNIFARRYFYPLISHFNPYSEHFSAKKKNLPVAESAAEKILCLPIFSNMEPETLEQIVYLIKEK